MGRIDNLSDVDDNDDPAEDAETLSPQEMLATFEGMNIAGK
jgi:hypothetical protein